MTKVEYTGPVELFERMRKVNLLERRNVKMAVRAEADGLDAVYNPVVKRSVVKWCTYEVERQHDTPKHVLFMIDAWRYAFREIHVNRRPNLLNILTLGYLVKPDVNAEGVRRYNVSVGWDQKLDWPHIPRALENLVSTDAFNSLSPSKWYREFEEIHPFGDGNGRVGSILYNWLRGDLNDPKYPPDVYDPHFWDKVDDDTFGTIEIQENSSYSLINDEKWFDREEAKRSDLSS